MAARGPRLHPPFGSRKLAVYHFDPDVRKRADEAHARERRLATKCSADLDYARGLRAYFASFRDPHIKPWTRFPPGLRPAIVASLGHEVASSKLESRYAATGVLLRRIGNGYYVNAIDSSLHPEPDVNVGDELVACDGKPPSTILEEEVLPYESVSVVEAAKYRYASSIFFRWERAAGSTSTCTFRRSGQATSVTMRWSPVDDDYLSKPSGNASIYSLEPRPYGHWVRLSSLAGYTPSQVTELRSFAEDAAKLRDDDVVVLDLRGNSGGDSSWGARWIENLYGSTPGEKTKPDFILCSPGNVGHFERQFALRSKVGFASPDEKTSYEQILAKLRANEGKLLPLESGTAAAAAAKVVSSFHGKLYVISDSRVFSSGELLLQSLRRLPSVTQVGIATNASTLAGDLRFDQTPNGVLFSLGTKVFQSIFVGRKPGEPLRPDMPIDEDAALEFQGRDSIRERLEAILTSK